MEKYYQALLNATYKYLEKVNGHLENAQYYRSQLRINLNTLEKWLIEDDADIGNDVDREAVVTANKKEETSV